MTKHELIMGCIAALLFLVPLASGVCMGQDDTKATEQQQSQDSINNGDAGKKPEDRQITDAEKAKVKEILAKYDPAKLTEASAKEINRSLKDAGLRNGPELDRAIAECGFDAKKLRELNPPPDKSTENKDGNDKTKKDEKKPGGNQYVLEQAISDNAQLYTISFDGLAFLTGSFNCNTFLPPGKAADFFGFQYMRDNDKGLNGHSGIYLMRIANNVLTILNDSQKQQLIALAKVQAPLYREFALKRIPLIKAFSDLLGPGNKSLDKAAVSRYVADLFLIDGDMSYGRAKAYGELVKSLTTEQKTAFAKLSFSDSNTWSKLEMEEVVDRKNYSHEVHVAIMTFASEFFSWYAGSTDADVYFCPERHATYFGSFYMKDIPAMGDPNLALDTALTGDSGAGFVKALNAGQAALVTGLVEEQRSALEEIVTTRTAISAELRRFIKGETADRNTVMALSKRYGELDGEIAYYYATAFAKISGTLSASQKSALVKLRNLDSKYDCPTDSIYIYSDRVKTPAIEDASYLFKK